MQLPHPVVLTNDDGIDAPGIRALQRVIGGGGIFVAPRNHHSGCSHLTTVDRVIPVEKRSAREFAVGGTPADSARIALTRIAPDAKLLLAGINEGGNLGHDTYCSGTVAAAREATYIGVPAVALSQYVRRELPLDWDRAVALARRALARVLEEPHVPGTFWNINLPHLEPGAPPPKLVFCETCTRPLPMAYHAEGEGYRYDPASYHTRERTPGADVDVCFGGNIAISRLSL